jgi:hypothetical protein
MPSGGTPRELLPITEKVLAFVARVRKTGGVDLEDLRRIELCALATREACYFHDLYGGGHAPAAPPQDER